MTTRPMEGVRILEVAQFTFTPSAGAVLADWGADVIKVEHAVAGDAQRGLHMFSGGAPQSFVPLMEHANRGKRSIGLALDTPEGIAVLYELARTSDVCAADPFRFQMQSVPMAAMSRPGIVTPTASEVDCANGVP